MVCLFVRFITHSFYVFSYKVSSCIYLRYALYIARIKSVASTTQQQLQKLLLILLSHSEIVTLIMATFNVNSTGKEVVAERGGKIENKTSPSTIPILITYLLTR
jgi:hypothetical protein